MSFGEFASFFGMKGNILNREKVGKLRRTIKNLKIAIKYNERKFKTFKRNKFLQSSQKSTILPNSLKNSKIFFNYPLKTHHTIQIPQNFLPHKNSSFPFPHHSKSSHKKSRMKTSFQTIESIQQQQMKQSFIGVRRELQLIHHKILS